MKQEAVCHCLWILEPFFGNLFLCLFILCGIKRSSANFGSRFKSCRGAIRLRLGLKIVDDCTLFENRGKKLIETIILIKKEKENDR